MHFCMTCLNRLFVVQVTDADVQRLREAVLPSPNAFLDDMQKFSCIPRNINNEETPLVCLMWLHLNHSVNSQLRLAVSNVIPLYRL